VRPPGRLHWFGETATFSSRCCKSTSPEGLTSRTSVPRSGLAHHPPGRPTGPLRLRPRAHRDHAHLVQRHRHASAGACSHRHPLNATITCHQGRRVATIAGIPPVIPGPAQVDTATGRSAGRGGAAGRAAGRRACLCPVTLFDSHAVNPGGVDDHPAVMADVEEVEVVVAYGERATLRVGDVFLKVDIDQTRTDVEVEAMALAPVPTPQVLWRKPPVLALAALPGAALGRLGGPSPASSAAWAAAGRAGRCTTRPCRHDTTTGRSPAPGPSRACRHRHRRPPRVSTGVRSGAGLVIQCRVRRVAAYRLDPVHGTRLGRVALAHGDDLTVAGLEAEPVLAAARLAVARSAFSRTNA